MNSQHDLMVVAIQDLITCRSIILDNLIALSLNGELSHLADAIDVGEDYPFTINHFRGLLDPNIKAMVKLCAEIESQIQRFMDANNIDITELYFI